MKVYAKHIKTGDSFFYRDGYTDIRGKLDYTLTGGDKLKDVRKFSIMVVSEMYGAKFEEVDPPQGVIEPEQSKEGDKAQVKQISAQELMSRKMDFMVMRSKGKMMRKKKM